MPQCIFAFSSYVLPQKTDKNFGDQDRIPYKAEVEEVVLLLLLNFWLRWSFLTLMHTHNVKKYVYSDYKKWNRSDLAKYIKKSLYILVLENYYEM